MMLMLLVLMMLMLLVLMMLALMMLILMTMIINLNDQTMRMSQEAMAMWQPMSPQLMPILVGLTPKLLLMVVINCTRS